MAKQRVFFTTLPRGVNPGNGRHRVSVFVTARLEPDSGAQLRRGGSSGGLSAFPDWVDWPDTVRNRIDWGLTVSADGEDYEPELTITSPTPVSDLWTDLYPPNSRVGDFTGPKPLPFSDKYVVSSPEKSLNDYLVGRLTDLAADPNKPSNDAVRDAYKAIDLYDPARDDIDLDDQLAEIIDQLSERGTVRNDPPRPDLDITQALLLAQPSLSGLREACDAARAGGSAQSLSSRVLRRGSPNRPDPPEPPRLDFHDAASAAAQHPFLLRRLGFIVDFEFTFPIPLSSQPRQILVALDVNIDSLMAPEDVVRTPTMFTRCLVSTTRFEAAPKAILPTNDRGLLRLSDGLSLGPRYALTQVDTQGAALRTAEHIKNLARQKRPELTSPFAPTNSPPPPLRAAGISVTQQDRASVVRIGYERQVALNREMTNKNSSASVILDEDDLTRGYVFDVFDSASNRWYSLCRRIGRARFGDDAENTSPNPLPGDVTWEDEGWVSAAFSTGYEDDDTVKRVTDSIATWANGWSMVTQRPGKSVSADEEPVDYVQEVGDFKLAVSYVAKPGSLPPQRFGRNYRIRARAVDLAGNVISSDEATAIGGPHSLEIAYKRYEPVPAPTILMRKKVTEGESPDLVVIRSNFGTAPASTVPSDRHIFPPSLDQFRSECHGMFDDGNGIRPDFYARIAAREDGAYDERDSSGNFVHPNAQADPGNYGAPYFDVDTPQFDVEGSTLARMPSLPDPMAGGFAFVGLPGVGPGSVQVFDAYRGGTTWPEIRPIRLRVFESASFVAPALVGDELRVGLPKAESFRVPLSSSLVASLLGHMAVPGQVPSSLQALIINGQHWAVTPSRTLRLVHAVRQPLRAADFNSLVLTRRLGETSVSVRDTLAISRKSTERVEVFADWVEKTDYLPPGSDEFHDPFLWEPEREVPVSAKAFELPVSPQGADGTLEFSNRLELHTTRHVPDISFRTVATTRFKEYFTESAVVSPPASSPGADLPSAYTGPAAGVQAVVEDSERVTSVDGKQTFERLKPGGPESEGFYIMDYEAGTIRRFDLTGRQNMPDEVRVTYIKREITRANTPQLRSALSVRRPDPPKILYAMPTFKRTIDSGTNFVNASRDVPGLRVFLDRPWWSSGDGELLGVVLNLSNSNGIEHLVTRRGKDPIWTGSEVTELPNITDFTGRVATGFNLTLPEAPSGRTFAVAGHEVKPDTENLRWYCDIDISPAAAYTPFIRLALARYQPQSIIGYELSPVSQLDYMQLYPGRYASLFRGDAFSASIYVSGTTYEGGAYKTGTGGRVPEGSVIQIHVERRRDDIPDSDDMFGWVTVPGSTTMLEYTNDSKGNQFWYGDVSAVSGDRLVIREYEQFGSKPGNAFQRRLVYAEAMYVPSYIGDL